MKIYYLGGNRRASTLYSYRHHQNAPHPHRDLPEKSHRQKPQLIGRPTATPGPPTAPLQLINFSFRVQSRRTEVDFLEALDLEGKFPNNSRSFWSVDSMQVCDRFRYFVISCVFKFCEYHLIGFSRLLSDTSASLHN